MEEKKGVEMKLKNQRQIIFIKSLALDVKQNSCVKNGGLSYFEICIKEAGSSSSSSFSFFLFFFFFR